MGHLNVRTLQLPFLFLVFFGATLGPLPSEAQEEGIRSDEMAELSIRSIRTVPEFPEPGESVRIRVEISNLGTGPGRGVPVHYSLNRQLLGARSVFIRPDSRSTSEFLWTAGRPGQYSIDVTLDPEGRVPETNRADNSRTKRILVTSKPPSGSRLTIHKVERVSRNGKPWIRIRAENRSASPLETPIAIRQGNHLVGSFMVGPILPGQVQTFETPMARISSSSTLDLTLEVDPRRHFGESLSRVHLLSGTSRPDLVVAAATMHSAKAYPGVSPRVTVSFEIKNVGEDPILQPFRTRLTPSGFGPDGASGSKIWTHQGLAAGESLWISHWIINPPSNLNVSIGTDFDRMVAETDETNNKRSAVYRKANHIGRWVSIGPDFIDVRGYPWKQANGRVAVFSADPTNPSWLYVGARGSGVFRSSDGGSSWHSVWYDLPTQKISGLSVDAANPSEVYTATLDQGVFFSPDRGNSWRQILADDNDVQFGAHWRSFIKHPTKKVLLVNTARGVHRSEFVNGVWTSWKTTLASEQNVSALSPDPTDPNRYYAAVTHDTDSNLAGIYESQDGGETFQKLRGCPGNSLPTDTAGKRISVTSSGGTVYAIFFATVDEAVQVRVYRTSEINCNLNGTVEALWEKGWAKNIKGESFYGSIWAHPSQPEVLFLRGVDLWRSTDGGNKFSEVANYKAKRSSHADHHALGAHPLLPSTVFDLNDGGIYRSDDLGKKGTWRSIGRGLANVEFYDHASAPTRESRVLGGTQDNGTLLWSGASSVWTAIRGGDGATVDVEPGNADVLYSMNQYAPSVSRSTNAGSKWKSASGKGSQRLPREEDPPKDRNKGFNFPWHVHPDPQKSSILLAANVAPGSRALWRTTNFGKSWQEIFTPSSGTIVRSTIDPSGDMYYAGASDGAIYAGAQGTSFREVYRHPQGRSVVDLEVAPSDGNRLIVAFRGTNGVRIGRLQRRNSPPNSMSFEDLTGDYPGEIPNTAAPDLLVPGRVFVGTARGVYSGQYSDAEKEWRWRPYIDGLPASADVRDLEVHPKTGRMRAATFGRSIYEVLPDPPIGSILAVSGKIRFLRVHDVGQGYGPRNDFLDAEVIVQLTSRPGLSLGLRLRPDPNEASNFGTYGLLLRAYAKDQTVNLAYRRTGIRTGTLLRASVTQLAKGN